MKDLHELTAYLYGKHFTLAITPFSWYLLWRYRCNERGDLNQHEIQTLCFLLRFDWISKKGKEGKKYRNELLKGHGIND